MPAQPRRARVVALPSPATRDEVARLAVAKPSAIPHVLRLLASHLATIGWSWLTFVMCAPPPTGATGDQRRLEP
jgi:hypothetical protein